MHTLVGDLWSLHARGYTLIIPTEGLRAPSSQALLNTKHARIAALRFPHFGAELGNFIAQSGHHSYYFPDYQLITLPISPDDAGRTPIEALTRVIKQVVRFVDVHRLPFIACPYWESDLPALTWDEIMRVVDKHWDDRFTLVSEPPRTP